jgi:hypothetical protein
MDSPRSRRERRLILPGSPATIAASSTSSMAGSSQPGPTRSPSGSRTVSTIAASTAPAAGHLASPTGLGDSSAADASAAMSSTAGWRLDDTL